jgi:hypothetical protein
MIFRLRSGIHSTETDPPTTQGSLLLGVGVTGLLAIPPSPSSEIAPRTTPFQLELACLLSSSLRSQ